MMTVKDALEILALCIASGGALVAAILSWAQLRHETRANAASIAKLESQMDRLQEETVRRLHARIDELMARQPTPPPVPPRRIGEV